MTILEELIEKRAARSNALAQVFKSETDEANGKPIIRNIIIRGNSGQDHVIRKGSELENVRRIDKRSKKPSENSVRRLLGLFGAED